MLRTALTIKIAKKQTSMNEKVIDYTIQFGYMGTVIKYDLPAIIYRALALVKKELSAKHFKFYSTIRLWSKKSDFWKDDVFSGDFNSNEINPWMQKFAKQIQDLIQSDVQKSLKQSILKFHFVLQPEGATLGTDSRVADSILNKKSVSVIRNDDSNCFWYALTVSLNKENKAMKDNRYPKKRNAFGLDLCKKCNVQWNEPVSHIHIPLVEEALNINIYVMSIENIPILGSAINIWNALEYRSEDRHTQKHWLLLDNNHYHVINDIKPFRGVKQFCSTCFKCASHNGVCKS